MQKMSGLELSYVAAELSSLAGKRISRIRKTPDGIFLFKIGTAELLVQPGIRLHLSRQILLATDTPDGFVSFLRKYLEGKTAEKISQYNNDRIVEITTRSKEKLIFELFRQGNIIFVDEHSKILSCLSTEDTGGRKIARGETYAYPQATDYSPKLPAKIEFLVQENSAGEPVSFSLDSSKGGRSFPTFSEALDFYYSNQKQESGKQKAAQEKVKKLQERLGSQIKILESFTSGKEEAKKSGDFIYANFEKIDQILSLVRQMKKSNASVEQINSALLAYKAKLKDSQIELDL